MIMNKNVRIQQPDRPEGLSGMLRKWTALALGIALIWVFIFVLAPWLQNTEAVKPLAEYVRESDIDASALYYTDVKETGEAEVYLRGALEYCPKGDRQK